jgi:ferrous iron transport protein B
MTTAAPVRYDPAVERALSQLDRVLHADYRLSRRAVGLLLLQGDAEIEALVRQREGEAAMATVRQVVAGLQAGTGCSLSYIISLRRQAAADAILAEAVHFPESAGIGWGERLSQAMMAPWTGVAILAASLVGLYLFVGVLGAQTLVAFLERSVFAERLNPWAERAALALIPWPVVRDLFTGPYGIVTLALRYAVAIILPVVGTFFLAFSIIEDSGYLPRLAMLIDRVFKRIGLNGRAVIPMVLGFGCDTMATVVTRTLETRRERVIATLLLALAIPCSAQLGVILAILAGHPQALVVWAMLVGATLLLVGFLAARLMPGERPSFYMELPPLRWPSLANVLIKTYTRMEWYFREVLPTFVVASVLIWLGRTTGLFDLAIGALAPVVRLLGLPDQAAVAFLFGFFRRDYGAAGLYDLHTQMTVVQMTVAAVTLTLFVPCIAQFAVMWKERGVRTTLGIVAFIVPFAFLVGAALNVALTAIGW